ncbi:MAG: ATP-binding protein [Chlorobium sp.]
MNDLGLNQLNLKIRRIHSNLNDPKFRDNLPYVPERTGFRVDQNLLTLLVEPLYGKNPSVGVRELMQNAVDAVCELDAWSKVHGVAIELLELPEQDGDVLIEFIERGNGSWFLRVCDRGIGMTSDTIKNYFLRASASFRNSEEWIKEFVDDDGKPRVARAGRFGIGAFAVFLLGHSFRLWTRHAGADKTKGYMITASADSQLIDIRRDPNLPVGTTVEVEMTNEAVSAFGFEKEEDNKVFGGHFVGYSDWFCWDWPKVVRRVVRGNETKLLPQQYVTPIRKSTLPPEWSVIYPQGFDAVYWTFGDAPTLSCNGLRIESSRLSWPFNVFEWSEEMQLEQPCVSVLDSASNLLLTIQRDKLSKGSVPFINELARDVILSFIAHALVCGPTSCAEAISSLKHNHPLDKSKFSQYDVGDHHPVFSSEHHIKWCITSDEMVPADAWHYSLLKTESCFIYGTFSQDLGKLAYCRSTACSIHPSALIT